MHTSTENWKHFETLILVTRKLSHLNFPTNSGTANSMRPNKRLKYPLPGPPIRPLWKWRKHTSFSPKYMNCQVRASKSAVLIKSSCFLSGLLVKKPYKMLSDEPFNQIKKTWMLFLLYFSSLVFPGPADHHSYIHQGHI